MSGIDGTTGALRKLATTFEATGLGSSVGKAMGFGWRQLRRGSFCRFEKIWTEGSRSCALSRFAVLFGSE